VGAACTTRQKPASPGDSIFDYDLHLDQGLPGPAPQALCCRILTCWHVYDDIEPVFKMPNATLQVPLTIVGEKYQFCQVQDF